MVNFLRALKLPGVILFIGATVWIAGWERSLAVQLLRGTPAARAVDGRPSLADQHWAEVDVERECAAVYGR